MRPANRRALAAAIGVPTFVLALLLVIPGRAPWSADGEEPPAAAPGFGPWSALFRGVDHATAVAADPRPLRLQAIRIDLHDPDVGFLVTPPNGDRPGETDGLKTSSFLVRYGVQLAINASPFRPVSAREGDERDVLGLSISRGEVYSNASEGYGALLLSKDVEGKRHVARIAVPPVDTEGVASAVGGFRLLLKDGANVAREDALHPRTAVGISADERHLYLLVIDGRQPGFSEGTTTAETADWLRKLGAHSGLNLDGGGSTSLAVTDGKGGYRLLNRPIHAGVPGMERVNGNHLGVFARPLSTGEAGDNSAGTETPRVGDRAETESSPE